MSSTINLHHLEKLHTTCAARLFLMGALVLLFHPSWGCSCGTVSIRKGFRGADVVFVGTLLTRIVSRHTDTLGIYQGKPSVRVNQQVRFTFLVRHAYKGIIKADTVSLVTTAGDADCGSDFLLGDSYLVYSWLSRSQLHDFAGNLPEVAPYLTTSICSRTKPNRLMTWYEMLVLRLL